MGRNIYVDFYFPWEGPLTPARRRIITAWKLTVVPLAALIGAYWAFNIPWGGSQGPFSGALEDDPVYLETLERARSDPERQRRMKRLDAEIEALQTGSFHAEEEKSRQDSHGQTGSHG